MYLIGIVGRAYYNKDNQKIIQTHETVRKAFSNYDNVCLITLLPTENEFYVDIKEGKDKLNTEKIDFILDKCDAFIVPGGSYYYKFDEYVINYAIKKDKPLLAICLGFQLLGSMFAKERIKFNMEERKDIPLHYGKFDEYQHSVTIKENTKLSKILNKKEIKTDSVHKCIVNFELKDITINAISEDGIIEGLELANNKFILGLQWHPEYVIDKNSKKIFDTFIKSIEE